MKKIFISFLLVIVLLQPVVALAQANSGFSLVPCGREGMRACTFEDIGLLIVRIINFLLACAGIVAVVFIFYASFQLVTSLGEPEKITAGKKALQNGVIGFALILLSFTIMNIVVNGILGVDCEWWKNPVGSCFTESPESKSNEAVGRDLLARANLAGASVNDAGVITIPTEKGNIVLVPVDQTAAEKLRQALVAKNLDPASLKMVVYDASDPEGLPESIAAGLSGIAARHILVVMGSLFYFDADGIMNDAGYLDRAVERIAREHFGVDLAERAEAAGACDTDAWLEEARAKTHDQMAASHPIADVYSCFANLTPVDIPETFTADSYIAWALSLGGQGTEGTVVGPYAFYDGLWHNTLKEDAAASQPSAVPVKGMWIEKDAFDLRVGDTAQTRLRVWYSEDGVNYSEDSNVMLNVSTPATVTASIDRASGAILLLAKAAGQALVTVHPVGKGDDLSQDRVISVRVVSNETSISILELSETSVSVPAGNAMTIAALVRMSDGSVSPAVSVRSSDSRLVSAGVSSEGVITVSASNPFQNIDPNLPPENQSYDAVLVVHPVIAGEDVSYDKEIFVSVYEEVLNTASIPDKSVPLYIKELSANRSLTSLTAEEIYQLNGYYAENAGILPGAFAPGSWIAYQLGLGNETPNSSNGLPLQAMMFGYQYQNGMYVNMFSLPTSDTVGSSIVDLSSTLGDIINGYNTASRIEGQITFGFYVGTQALEGFGLTVAAKTATSAFNLISSVTSKVFIPAVVYIMIGIELVKWWDTHRRTQHYKEDDTRLADDMMSKIQIVVNTYGNNQARNAEEEKMYHDQLVTVINSLYYTTAAYFKLERSLESQRHYVDQFVQSMDNLLQQRLSSFGTL